jgi:hypothetical protein
MRTLTKALAKINRHRKTFGRWWSSSNAASIVTRKKSRNKRIKT